MKILKMITLLMMFSVLIHAQQNKMGWLKVEGNKFVDENGKAIVFRGVNISDPDKLEKAGKWDKKYFEEAKTWGSNIIRIPIHPATWRTRGTDAYLKLIDQAIEWAKELNIYLIIDWHSIGNLRTELYFKPGYITTKKETFEFWKTISTKYANEPVVAFYELFNEPTTMVNQLGSCSWKQWKELVTDMIVIIRANNPKAIPLVAGFNWGYDLSEMKNDMLNIEGIAYVSHPYPEKRKKPWEQKWEKDWGFMAKKAPVILTEIGFALPDEKGVHVPVNGDEEYGKILTDYSKKNGISWVVWVFDPNWAPMMFKDWNYTPTRQGAFFKKVMTEKE